jgi:hypothetical protein
VLILAVSEETSKIVLGLVSFCTLITDYVIAFEDFCDLPVQSDYT